MQRSTLINGTLAFLIGLAVMFAEATVAGLHAYYYLRGPALHDLTGIALYVQALAASVLVIWGLASLVGAWLIALLKPRRWLLYSVCAVAPGVILAAWGAVQALAYGIPLSYHYQLLSELARLSLVPLLLALVYATIRWQQAA